MRIQSQNEPALTGKVVLDAMGSDHAPHVEIDGALAAARDFGVKVVLVGQAEKVEPELKRCGWRGDGDRGIEFVEAAEVIAMADPVATSVRRKKKSSLRIGTKLVSEGRDVFSGMADVIVTDGFTGNVMLKLSEGLTEAMHSMLKRELTATAVTKAGAVLAKPAFQSINKRLDYTEYGGAPLLGVRRIVVIGHGRSNARAIRNAIRSMKEFSTARAAERIEKGIATSSQLVA